MLAVILYAPSLGIWAYGDDFDHLVRAVDPAWRWKILETASFVFRPLERSVNSLNVTLLGYETTILSHAFALLGFLVTVVMVYKLSLMLLAESRIRAAVATAFFIVHPANVMSIIQIDTISQQYSVVFSIMLTCWLLGHRHRRPVVTWFFAGLLAFLALSSKETALGTVLAIPLVVHLLWCTPNSGSRRARVRKLGFSYSAIAVALCAYMALRLVSGATLGGSGEHYDPQLNFFLLVRNAAWLASGLVYTGSSLDLFPHPQLARIGVSTALTLGLGVLGIVGLLDLARRIPNVEQNSNSVPRPLAIIAGLGILVVAGMFPVVLIGHMSELYIYSSSPFYTILLVLLVGRGYQIISSSGRSRSNCSRTILVFLTVAMAWMAWGTREKIGLALNVSERATTYYRQTKSWLTTVPQSGVILCWRSDLARSESGAYSVFIVPDRLVLRGVISFMGRLEAYRVDIETWCFVDNNLDAHTCDYEAYVDEEGLSIVSLQSLSR